MTDDEIGGLVKAIRARKWLRPYGADARLDQKAATALASLQAERKMREALEAAIRGHLDGPTQMHLFAIARAATAPNTGGPPPMTPDIRKDELKPCPFCGGPAELVRVWVDQYAARCPLCVDTPCARPREKAIEAWNRRARGTGSTLQAPAPALSQEREAFMGLLASLVAAVSLLERGGKKAAPSDKMFAQMIEDYKRSIERARALITDKEAD